MAAKTARRGLIPDAASSISALRFSPRAKRPSTSHEEFAIDVQLQAARLFGRPADRQPASRQLSRRDPPLRPAAGQPRLHLLRGRPARHHHLAGPGRAHARDARGDRRLPGGRHRPEEEHRLQPEPRRPARRACLDLQLRRAHGLAEPHDAVQGKGRQGPRERLGRAVRLSQPDGGRHPGLPRHACAGRRRPEAASRADPRHRAKIQQRLFRRASPSSVPASR